VLWRTERSISPMTMPTQRPMAVLEGLDLPILRARVTLRLLDATTLPPYKGAMLRGDISRAISCIVMSLFVIIGCHIHKPSVIQLPIQTILRHQGFVPTALDNSAGMHNTDQIGVANGAEPMRNHDRGAPRE
jgi:hypothetical protein